MKMKLIGNNNKIEHSLKIYSIMLSVINNDTILLF